MKIKLCVLALLLAATVAPAQTNNLTSLLQQGLLEEQGNRNLDAAIADYQSLSVLFDKDRQVAATAVFRLGECYRAQGKTNEAAAQYERVLREFPDQNTLATMSRQNLTGLGVSVASAAPPVSDAGRQKQRQLLQEEIKVVEQEFQTQQAQFKLGMVSADTSLATEEKLLELKRQLAALEGGQAVSLPDAAATDDEDQEIERIRQMMQNSPDLINASGGGNPGNGLLVPAAGKGELRVATFLLDHGAEINPTHGELPLYMAARNAQKTMVELLLSRGADVNAGSGAALLAAAQGGYQAVVEVLLAHKADVNVANQNGNTPLTEAAYRGRVNIMQMLLAAGANPNVKGDGGETALMFAALASSPEAVKVLLAAGADPNEENSEGMTTLSLAVEHGSPEIAKMLLAAKADPNAGKVNAPLLCAIHKRDTVSAELLLKAGANPNATGDAFLLNDGFDPSHFPNDWTSLELPQSGSHHRQNVAPLWLAIRWNELPMVNLLLQFKADPNVVQLNRDPLLFSALPYPEILEALLDAGAKAEVHTADNLTFTLLRRAIQENNVTAVELLLKHGANPNLRDVNGDTPLHFAAAATPQQNQIEGRKIFELLLDHHADPNVQDNGGQTPLTFLNRLGDNKAAAEIADLLRQHGAMDNPPQWDRIDVNRLSANVPITVFRKGAEDWNQFTLLETILNYYRPVSPYMPYLQSYGMPFPDLSRVLIVRPSHGSTNETRITVNLLNSTNGIDCSKDVPLEFGDMVEIPPRDHSLGEQAVYLTDGQHNSMFNCLKGKVQLVAHDQKVELPIYPTDGVSTIGDLLGQTEARQLILASSDLSRVKVIRREAKTGEKREWIVDCGKIGEDQTERRPGMPPPRFLPGPRALPGRRGGFAAGNNVLFDASQPASSPDLRLRDGDVIEVPEKP